MQDFNKKHDSLAETAKEILDENRYKDMSVDEKAYWQVVKLIDTLKDTLKKESKSNKTRQEGVNFDRDFKEILDENQYRNMSVDDVTRAVDALSNVLRKGSNLNKYMNKTRGGPGVNFDRDFKELKDAMDIVYEKWEDLVWQDD